MISFSSLGVRPGVFYLPRPDVPLATWSVIACDQFTSQNDYWQETERLVGQAPSALRLTLPEVYLDEAPSRIPQINAAMADYLRQGVLRPLPEGFILITRQVSTGTRTGLLALLDLETYDFAQGSQTLTRATEGTVLARIPPRVAIRQNAPLEMGHILVLMDDKQKTVLEPLVQKAHELPLVYDFDLMQGGGHITGRLVSDPGDLASIARAFAALQSPAVQNEKYANPGAPFLFAVGDGNHSLATAKTVWNDTKKHLPQDQWADHPARFAMVELNNLYEDSLIFEPIHRIVENVDVEDLLCACRAFSQANSPYPPQQVLAVAGDKDIPLRFDAPAHSLPVGTLQIFLDEYLAAHPHAAIDYIHGDSVVRSLAQTPRAVGFLLPPIGKDAFFQSILKNGPLPRKTFSMGHASDKRYYLESRPIR